MNDILAWIENHSTLPWIIGFMLGSCLVLLVGIWMIRVCMEILRLTGKSSFTVPKIIIVAVAPTVYYLSEILDFEVNSTLIIILTVAACIIVSVWNLVSFGPLGSIFFSILHIAGGLIAGFGVAAMVFVVIALVAAFFIGGSASSSSGTSGGRPSSVVDVKTGQGYYTDTDASGALRLPEKGNAILRPSSYAGRYFDDYGNEYIAR